MFVRFAALALATVSVATALIAVAKDKPDIPRIEDPSTYRPYVSSAEWAEQCEEWDDWDKPAPAFKIYGDVFYVGTCGITVLLVRTTNGFVLLDTSTAAGAVEALRNIERMGLDERRIGLILLTHDHFDHVGGLWIVQQHSGAPALAAPAAAKVLLTGEGSPDDPQFGMHEPMKPATNVIEISPETAIVQGGKRFVPIFTPGHTPGAMSWQWESCEAEVCKTIVYADSLSAISSDDYRFSDNPDYVADFRAGIDRLRGLKCDILLTPHPSASNMLERAATGTFEGGVSCLEYADAADKRLDDRLAKEAGTK